MGFYVYIHRRKTTGEVFYIGKGRRRRAWSSSGRNKHWGYVAKKHGFTVEIYASNLQEWYAFELEKDLIAYYGRVQDKTGVNSSALFSKKKRQASVKGWSLSPQQPE